MASEYGSKRYAWKIKNLVESLASAGFMLQGNMPEKYIDEFRSTIADLNALADKMIAYDPDLEE